ncbi:unnamed protein product [Penicillium nalgiovense]|nr:unnamed protein product [Penicillium nalgiovense]
MVGVILSYCECCASINIMYNCIQIYHISYKERSLYPYDYATLSFEQWRAQHAPPVQTLSLSWRTCQTHAARRPYQTLVSGSLRETCVLAFLDEPTCKATTHKTRHFPCLGSKFPRDRFPSLDCFGPSRRARSLPWQLDAQI